MKHDFLGVCIGGAAIYAGLLAFGWACEVIGFWWSAALIIVSLQLMTVAAHNTGE